MRIEPESPGRVALYFPYDEHLVARVKALSYCRFHRDPERWVMPETRLEHFRRFFPQAQIDPRLGDEWTGAEAEYIRGLPDCEQPPEMHCELFPYQRVGIAWLRRFDKPLLADVAGCVDGDAFISINRAGAGRRYKIRDVYRKLHGNMKYKAGGWLSHIPTRCRALCDGFLMQHKVQDVLFKGNRPVLKLTLKSGKTLRLTPDHEVRTEGDREWTPAELLRLGDKVLTNGVALCSCGLRPVTTYPYSKFFGRYCRTCIYRYHRNNHGSGGHIDKDGYVVISGQFDHLRARGTRVPEHILVMEKKIGRSIVAHKEHVHHKNEDKSDNRPENLEVLTPSEHHKVHKKFRNMDGGSTVNGGIVRFIPLVDTVVSVEPDGETGVYDIVMEDPHRNFVANGIIVHNCGKTRQAIGWAVHKMSAETSGRGVLVVCPASVKSHWQHEIEGALPEAKVQVGYGVKAQPIIGEWIILNWDIIGEESWSCALAGHQFAAVILDEAQLAKSAEKSLRGDAALQIARRHRCVLPTTGSPVMNQPQELEAILLMLGRLDEADRFAWRIHFCKGEQITINPKAVKYHKKKAIRRWQFKGASHLDELEAFCRPFTLRRNKEEVLPQLPDVLYTYPACELSSRPAYEAAAAELRDKVAVLRACRSDREATALKGQMLAIRTKLLGLCAEGKLAFIQAYLDERAGAEGKTVVFSEYLKPLQILSEQLGALAVTITGDNVRDRESLVRKFRDNSAVRFALCSRAACGVGMDGLQQVADTVVFASLPYGPEQYNQARDRVYRLGQTRKVQVVTPLAENSIDLAVVKILYRKAEVIQKLFPHADMSAYEGMLEAAL